MTASPSTTAPAADAPWPEMAEQYARMAAETAERYARMAEGHAAGLAEWDARARVRVFGDHQPVPAAQDLPAVTDGSRGRHRLLGSELVTEGTGPAGQEQAQPNVRRDGMGAQGEPATGPGDPPRANTVPPRTTVPRPAVLDESRASGPTAGPGHPGEPPLDDDAAARIQQAAREALKRARATDEDFADLDRPRREGSSPETVILPAVAPEQSGEQQ